MNKTKCLFVIVLLVLGQIALLSADRLVTNTPLKAKADRATISVTDMTGGVTATDMVNSILGGGVTPSNIVYTGSPYAGGVFSGGTGAGIGINQGIMLSSGSVLNALGPNENDDTTANFALPGDTDLTTLIGGPTNDACVLEFDFVPTSANFQFTFVMGSEEYEEYINYADVFAFYLNGVNIALIPSTTTPIAISTINQNVNTAYYVSNYLSTTYDIECDGFTIPISLNATVIPNQTNHIKLAIADYQDWVYDTWIFINGGSFTSGYNVNITSNPSGATIFKNGVSTGLVTPNTILQATGTTASYSVTQTGWVYAPPSIEVPTINADQNIHFDGTPSEYTFEVNAYDLDWYTGMGYSFPVPVPAYNDPNDLQAEILLNGLSLVPPAFTPYTFGVPFSHPFVSGTYSVVKAGYSSWLPNDITFFSITTNYAADFLGIPDENTPVELSSFTAMLTAQNYVQLSWVSQTESNMMGYRVYRNETDNEATATMITPVLIPATNTSSQQTYSVIDNEVEIGTTYYYWLEGVDMSSSEFFGPLSIVVEGEVPPVIPEVSSMKNAYPNPFKATSNTNIEVALKAGENGTVTIYNVLGQVVRSFSVVEGTHTITWNGMDSKGEACSSGIYFYKLSTPSLNQTKKMVILK